MLEKLLCAAVMALLFRGEAIADSMNSKFPITDWIASEKTDRITDKTWLVLTAATLDKNVCGFLKQPAYVDLRVQCSKNKTAIYFTTNCYLSTGDHNRDNPVMFRFDKNPAVSVSMRTHRNNKAIGLSGDAAIDFVHGLLGRKTMTVRLFPFESAPITMSFRVEGLEKMIKLNGGSCSW